MNQSHLLKDLKIVELATVLAGPAVGMFFAELGAKVTKVENPRTGGDVTRSWKLAMEDQEHPISAYFCSINAFKEHVFLDLTIPGDRLKLDVYLEEADILLVNFKKGDSQKFDLDPKDLFKRFPRLIVGNIAGFKSQPDRTAYDVVVQAECGFMGMNGTADSGPIKLPVALMDILAAHQLKEGLLVALLQRTISGEGSWVEASLEEAALTALANQASNYLMNQVVAQRIGSLHPNIAPYGETFVCQDGKEIVLAVGSDGQFMKMCEILGDYNLASDLRFTQNSSRVRNRAELGSALSILFKQTDRDNILSRLIENNVPAGGIRQLDEVLESKFAKSLIIETDETGRKGRRMSTIGFSFKNLDELRLI